MNRSAIRAFMSLIVLLAVWPLSGFTDTESRQQKVLIAERPLYLEEHLGAAHIVGSKVPEDILKPVEWRFDEPQSDWKPLKPRPVQVEAVETVQVKDALRLPLSAKNRMGFRLFGSIYVELPDWNIEDWAYVEVRVRTRDPLPIVGIRFNYTEEDFARRALFPFYSRGDDASRPLADGTVQMYRLSLE
ncbi:MAG: hypothetical protein PVJ86_12900, partial [Phycisphaerales bacterium]